VAPVLLCPECGTKHPLDEMAGTASFPCSGCGRTLKVPAQARQMSADRNPDGVPPPVAPVAAPEPHATQVLAATPPIAAPPMGAPVAAAAASVAPPVAPPLAPAQGFPRVTTPRPRASRSNRTP
jgi:hypothetical protein